MSAQRVMRYGLLTSPTLVLGLTKRQFVLIPDIPGIRLSISNPVLLYALCLLGAGSAWLCLGLIALPGGAFYSGVTGFFYTLAGSVLAMAAMLLAPWKRGIRMAGVSVCGAILRIAGQLAPSRLALGSRTAALQTPVPMMVAMATAIPSGLVAQAVWESLARGNPEKAKRLKVLGLRRTSQ